MKKLLLIDDEDAIRSGIGRILERSGYQVDTAPDGRSGLELFNKNKHDLVITDIIMPNMDGVEFILEAKNINPDVIIFAISGGGRISAQDHLSATRKLGAAEVLIKPFDPADLLALVAKYLQP